MEFLVNARKTDVTFVSLALDVRVSYMFLARLVHGSSFSWLKIYFEYPLLANISILSFFFSLFFFSQQEFILELSAH